MIDQVFIQVSSGNGGNGAVSGRHEKYVPRGGPDGGNGGKGGDVYVVCDSNINTLLSFRYRRHFEGGSGGNGSGARRHGRDGDNVDVEVPAGTQIWLEGPEPKLLGDLTVAGDRILLAGGGRGGRGNASFSSSTNQYPVIAEQGGAGEVLKLRLELKLLADVGVMGEPNAGKSSLLSAVSAATPKIADYPFTTLEASLGVVEHRRESFVVVDIPGLIEGAHNGVGLGLDFLRHVERTRVLIHLVDGSQENPRGAYDRVNEELALFNEALLTKPQVVVVNKTDIEGVAEAAEAVRRTLPAEVPFHQVSAATHEGLGELLDTLLQLLKEAPAPEDSERAEVTDTVPVIRPESRRREVRVSKEKGAFVVYHSSVQRIAALINLDDWRVRTQFYARLKRVGVIRALERAGVGPGDTVRIGDVEWEWE